MVREILRLCEERGLTVTQLGRTCGIPSTTIYRWDKHIPSVDKVKRVADTLGVTVDELIAYADFAQTEKRKEESHGETDPL